MADLEALLKRVEEADGPDRELDGDLWRHLCPGGRAEKFGPVPLLTASLDASIALVERTVGMTEVKWMLAQALDDCDDDWSADRLARRVLYHLLRALIAERTKG